MVALWRSITFLWQELFIPLQYCCPKHPQLKLKGQVQVTQSGSHFSPASASSLGCSVFLLSDKYKTLLPYIYGYMDVLHVQLYSLRTKGQTMYLVAICLMPTGTNKEWGWMYRQACEVLACTTYRCTYTYTFKNLFFPGMRKTLLAWTSCVLWKRI